MALDKNTPPANILDTTPLPETEPPTGEAAEDEDEDEYEDYLDPDELRKAARDGLAVVPIQRRKKTGTPK